MDEPALTLVYPCFIADEDISSESKTMSHGESDIEAQNHEEEDTEIVEEEKQKQLLEKALEKGHIETGLDVLLFIGAAGSGKSHYKHLCLGLPPPEVRDSTGLSEHPVRTMSLVRGAVKEVSQKGETTGRTGVQWHKVSDKRFIEMIIESIKEGSYEKISDSTMMVKLENRATEEHLTSTLNIKHGLDTTEYMSSTQKESAEHKRSDISVLVEVASENNVVTQSERPSSGCVQYKSNFYKELVKTLVSLSTSQTKPGKLLDVDWLYIVDSGGQPQFREMLPILVKMATACVLTLKLNVPLGKQNQVECVERGKELCKPYLSVLTNEQVVKHCSQIVDSQTKDCKLFVVGTHRDLEHECQTESRRDKNEKLLELLQPQLGPNLEMYNDVDLIYPVNSKKPEDADERVVEQFRRAVHNICLTKKKVNIPLYWFLVELLLHELAPDSGILSFEGCKKEASLQLKISEEEFHAAVKFLANNLGTVLYFSEVLPDIIFKPEALINILSEIVKCHHLLKDLDGNELPTEYQGHSGDWLEFKRSGIMTETLLLTTPLKGFFLDLLKPNHFLKVMMDLLIVAKISGVEFFFPSVLEEISPEEVREKTSKSHDCLAPLVLRCSDTVVRGHIKENWLPVGSFTSLVARLLNVNKWILHTHEENRKQYPLCLYRNCVQFTLPENQPGIVTLVDQFRHMEVYLQVESGMAKRISKSVRRTVLSGLKEVQKSENKIELAFLCQKHNECYITPDRSHWKWACKQDHVNLEEATEKQRLWLNQGNIFSSKILCPYICCYIYRSRRLPFRNKA